MATSRWLDRSPFKPAAADLLPERLGVLPRSHSFRLDVSTILEGGRIEPGLTYSWLVLGPCIIEIDPNWFRFIASCGSRTGALCTPSKSARDCSCAGGFCPHVVFSYKGLSRFDQPQDSGKCLFRLSESSTPR